MPRRTPEEPPTADQTQPSAAEVLALELDGVRVHQGLITSQEASTSLEETVGRILSNNAATNLLTPPANQRTLALADSLSHNVKATRRILHVEAGTVVNALSDIKHMSEAGREVVRLTLPSENRRPIDFHPNKPGDVIDALFRFCTQTSQTAELFDRFLQKVNEGQIKDLETMFSKLVILLSSDEEKEPVEQNQISIKSRIGTIFQFGRKKKDKLKVIRDELGFTPEMVTLLRMDPFASIIMETVDWIRIATSLKDQLTAVDGKLKTHIGGIQATGAAFPNLEKLSANLELIQPTRQNMLLHTAIAANSTDVLNAVMQKIEKFYGADALKAMMNESPGDISQRLERVIAVTAPTILTSNEINDLIEKANSLKLLKSN